MHYPRSNIAWTLTKVEKDRVIWTGIINLEHKITRINPKISLGMRWPTKRHFLHTSEDGFIIWPPYLDIHLSYALRSVIGQLWTSSHQLELEVGRYTQIPLEERICWLCHQGVESKEQYVYHCSVFYENRGRYHCLFKQGFGPQHKVMEYEDQRCLGSFLLELKRHRGKLLKDNSTTTNSSGKNNHNFL